MGRGMVVTVCGLLFVLASLGTANAAPVPERPYYIEDCRTWGPPCESQISYFAKGETLGAIADLFVVDILDILGANNLDIMKANALKDTRVPNGTLVQVPMSCLCDYPIRRTNTTVYTVKAGDTLSKIADEIFNQLTKYSEIGVVNKIANVDQIKVGEEFVIPFTCSCPRNVNSSSIGLTYQVQPLEDLTAIAAKFGSSANLAALNNITNTSALQAKQLIRVPVPACLSNFSGGAQDIGLIVASGAYKLTPEDLDCVQCKCYGSPTPSMHCVPNPARNLSKCPSLDCSTNLVIGNFTATRTGDGKCQVNSCEYKGYMYLGRVDKPITQQVLPTCPEYTAAPNYNEIGTIPGSPLTPATPGAPPGSPGGPGGPPANNSSTSLSSKGLVTAMTALVSVILFSR